MADFDDSIRKEFSNWVHNILALNVTKTALHKRVLDKWAAEICKWKIESIDTLLQFFSEVENGVVTYRHRTKWVCSQKHSECSKILDGLNKLRQNESFTISCKTVLCRKIVHKDIKEPDAVAVLREISGESPVKTNKTDPKDKCNDYSKMFKGCKTVHIWCFANMFMQSDSFKNNICNTGPGDTDSAMFFRMMKNCKLFELDRDLYQQVIDVRNRLHHSAITRLKAQDSKTNLKTMKTLLKQFPDAECKDAITKIDKMEHHTICLGDVKKALYLKTVALDTDIKIDRAKGYSCGDMEELRIETKQQFHHTDLIQFMTLKSSEDIKKENEKYPEMIEELVRKSSCLEIIDLQDELKEHTKMLAKSMEETDFQTGDKLKAEDLLADARDVRSAFDDLKEQRFKVTNVVEGSDFHAKIMINFKELREEVKNTKQELAELREQTNKTPIGNTKDTENQGVRGASEVNGQKAKKDTMDTESRGNRNTSVKMRAVSAWMEDFEDFSYDIDEFEIFQDKTNLEPNKISESNEASQLPHETFSMSGRRFIASVNFGHAVTQLTVSPSNTLATCLQNKDVSNIHLILELLQLLTERLSSKILLNRIMEVEEYGSEAKKQYDELGLKWQREQYFYFESLRTSGSVGLSETLQIEDVTGRSMNAVDVYGAAIRYLKKKVLDEVSSKSYKQTIKGWKQNMPVIGFVDDGDLSIDYSKITDDDIFWVFTGPAVSSVSVKSCIIEAAGKAGIKNEHVAVIPEPVATLAYCYHTPELYDFLSDSKTSLKNYTKYVIVDAGVQTVTISTYEVTDQSIFKELEAPVECTVHPNAAYEDFVTEVIGKKASAQRSSSEADVILLVGQAVYYKVQNLNTALKKKFPNKRRLIPKGSAEAVVSGAALCCCTQMTITK